MKSTSYRLWAFAFFFLGTSREHFEGILDVMFLKVNISIMHRQLFMASRFHLISNNLTLNAGQREHLRLTALIWWWENAWTSKRMEAVV